MQVLFKAQYKCVLDVENIVSLRKYVLADY